MRLLSLFVIALTLAGQTYRVSTSTGVVRMDSEDYVAGVVAGEAETLQSDEALRSMAIAARTYAARLQGRHAAEGFDFCTTTHCQRYVAASVRTTRIVQETKGQLLWFNGKPAFSVYSRNCGGMTEDVSAVWADVTAPYLSAHADPFCRGHWTWAGSREQIQQALAQAGLHAPAHLTNIVVLRRTASGRAQMLSLDGELLSASAFRFAMGRFIAWSAVRSELYNIESTGGHIVFRGSGEGHGVGLCQIGADQMGSSGRNFREILAFYYPGASLRANEMHWQHLSSEGFALFTLTAATGGTILATAEDITKRWRGRLPWPPPAKIEIYAYPNLDSFRNATGEPGWVAGRTSRTRIELSSPVVRSTLEHEMVHCYIEAAAKTGLPVWFREGLVEHLVDSSIQIGRARGGDAELRQRQDRTSARSAYEAAKVRVDWLVMRYGETTVLSWVTRGLPAEVTNSKANNPAVNSR